MLPPVDFLLIGHCTADLTPQGRFLGGTVSYGARTAHAFGLRVGVVTSAAPGEPLLAELAPYAHLIAVDAPETTTFENIYTPEGRLQYLRGRAGTLTLEHIPAQWRSAPLVHLGPLADEVDPRMAAAFPVATVLLTLQGLLRQWDASGRVVFRRWYERAALTDVDIVVFSEEDIQPAPDLESAFAASVPHLIVTRAEKGGSSYQGGSVTSYDTPQVQVVHSTGAGDVFAVSLLCALHRLGGDTTARALRVAARLAATCVTRFALEGTPTPAEVQAALGAV
ncbi:MAG: hypothetical protein HXY40_10415 [Chloroflexi bacterium]|nr:hypothetical protein [Chloroflexota bacterium]